MIQNVFSLQGLQKGEKTFALGRERDYYPFYGCRNRICYFP